MTVAGKKYIAIPIDGLDIFELSPVVQQVQRLPRQTEAYVMANVHQNEPESQVPRIERSNQQILDYVDFGSQTGANGAYSWYADYPAHIPTN